ncbi:MAG: hypothetical protein CMN30_12785 [Sandaracinus sp.]|nr:hypothetical protein [Sandaracinus sp.]|tara:strand:+ start:1126 stop:2715 length:1590 start_codon:yes stop_codon:yes gene_type:complete
MGSIAALFIGCLLGCGGASTEATTTTTTNAAEVPPLPPAPTFGSTRVLKGPEGLKVELAEFGEEAYLRITGLSSPVAGVVFQTQLQNGGRTRTEYVTTRDGHPYHPLHKETMGGGTIRWTLYAPGLAEGTVLEWDEEGSAALDAAELHAVHHQQAHDGTLDAIQRFDRDAAIASNTESLAREVTRTNEACGASPTVELDFDSVPDEVMVSHSVSSLCDDVLGAFRNLCRFAPGKELYASLQRIECAWRAEGSSLTLDDGTVSWSVATDVRNRHEVARDGVLAVQMPTGQTLDQEITYAQSSVCRSPDGEHIVIVHPHVRGKPMGISYGTAEEVYHSPQVEDAGRGWFFDPRQSNTNNNRSYRGLDLAFYSHVNLGEDGASCSLTCGERETEWTLLPRAEARTILTSAESKPAPFDRAPYALARDRRGIYYYVDRGNTPETRNDFRVYRGRRGQMELLQMQDIVSDSEGQIFATASGSLRFLVDNEGAHWVENERPKELRRVPIEDNYQLIMEQLGIYMGQRFELPCDDH